MDPERWKQIEQLYHSVLKCEQDQRAALLEEACGSDDDLRRKVQSLLAYERSAESFIESPPVGLAAQRRAEEETEPTILTRNEPPSHPLLGQTVSHYRILQ